MPLHCGVQEPSRSIRGTQCHASIVSYHLERHVGDVSSSHHTTVWVFGIGFTSRLFRSTTCVESPVKRRRMDSHLSKTTIKGAPWNRKISEQPWWMMTVNLRNRTIPWPRRVWGRPPAIKCPQGPGKICICRETKAFSTFCLQSSHPTRILESWQTASHLASSGFTTTFTHAVTRSRTISPRTSNC